MSSLIHINKRGSWCPTTFRLLILCHEFIIYIIITKNICYLLWNRGFWCSLNNTYPIFLTLCIRCTKYLWFLWLNWRKSTFYPVSARNDWKCWPIVMSSIPEPAAGNCDVTMTDCSRVVAMDAFLAQWNRKFITVQWSTENTSCCNFFVYLFFYFVTPPTLCFNTGHRLCVLDDKLQFRTTISERHLYSVTRLKSWDEKSILDQRNWDTKI